MADHGIIIDVGFQPQIEEFIGTIQSEFKKINYDEIIGLSDAFDKQKKEVEKKLKDLSQQINEAINGKIGKEPLQQVKDLQKSVDSLCSGFKELVKTLPKGQAQALASSLGNISDQADEMNSTLTETISSIKEIAKVSGEVTVAPLNKKRIDELAESYRALAKAQQLSQNAYIPKKHGNKSYENEELARKDLDALLKQYNSINKEISGLDKESSDYISKLDNLKAKLVTTLTELSRLSITLGDLGVSGDTLITPTKSLEQLQDLFETKLDKLLSYISDRKAKIQAEFTSIGGEGSLEDTLFKKSEAKRDIIKIPVDIQNGAEKRITSQLNELIEKTNKNIKDNPLLLEVKLVSGVQSKNTQDILSKIRAELKQIDNNEISSALEQLLDQANRQIDNTFIININVATKKASAEIKEFIKQAKEDLGQKVTFDPELTLSKANIDKFQKQLDDAGFTIDLSDFISGISELKTILDSDDSKLIKNLNEIKTISADIKALFADLSSGKIKINSPIIEGGIVESVELTEEDKKRINEKLQDITVQIKDMLATDQIDNWSNDFINALRKISNEIKVLFGGQANVLSDLLEDFNFSDKLMQRTNGSLTERSGVIGTDHNMYGFGTYDRGTKNSYVSEIVKELRSMGVTPSIGYHSHGALKKVAPSINDIMGSIIDGLNAEIIQGLDEIVVFDTKGFLEANKDIDFSKFKKKLEDAENKLAKDISDGIDKGLSEADANEVFTTIFKQRLPEIFESVLPKTKYKGKIEDFIQTMGLNEFRNNNPLGLDKESMNSLVQTSGMKKALEVLDQITEKIEIIKNANKDRSLNGAFNLNIDVKQVSVLTDKIQELIDLLSQLPQLFTTAFSPKNVKVTKTNTLNSQLDDIRKEKEESQRELDELFKQIQSLKNPTVRKAPTMGDVANNDIIKTLQAKAGEKKEIYKFVEELKKSKNGELSKKSIKSLQEMLANSDIEDEFKQLIEQTITDKKLLQSAMAQVNSINKEQKEIHKTTKSKTKQPETNEYLQRVREQQEKVEKHNQEKTAKLIEELEAKASLLQQRINSLNQKEQELVRAINEMSDDEVISDNQVIVNVQKENDELTEQQSLLKEINELWEEINSNRTKSGNISQSKSSGNLDRLTELGSKLRELKKIGGFANLGLSDKDKKVVGKYYNQTDAPSSPIVVEPVVDKDAFESLPKLVDELVPDKEEIEITPNIDKDAFENLPKLIDESAGLKDLDKAKNVLDYIRKVYSELGKTKSGKFTESQSGKAALDDLGTRLYSYSKYIGKSGEIPNLKKVLGDSDLSEQNEKLILKYYQNAINRAEELNAMLTEAPKLVDDNESIKPPKLVDDNIDPRLLKTDLENVLKVYTLIDQEIVDITGSFDKLLERGFAWSSLTGEHTKFDAVGEHSNFASNYNYRESNIQVDSALHTHPEEYVRISALKAFGGDGGGDLMAWYHEWLDGIRTQFIRGLKETLQFDAESFYSDLKEINKNNDGLSDREYIRQINEAIDANQEYFFQKSVSAKDLGKFTIAKQAYIDFINRLSEDTATLSNIFGEENVNDGTAAFLINQIKENIGNISIEKGSVGNFISKSIPKEELSKIYGTKESIAKILISLCLAGIKDIGVNGVGDGVESYSTQFAKIFGQKFAEMEESAFNYVLQDMVKNGKHYSDYVKRFDNTTFDSKIWSSFIPNTNNYSDKNIVFETDAVIQDTSKLAEKYEEEAQAAEKATEKNRELAKERELASDKYSDDQIVFETDAVLKDNAELVEQYEKQGKSVEETRKELQESLAVEERYLKICKEGSEAYNKRLENIRKIKEELSALVNFTTVGEPQSYGFTMKDSEVDGSKDQPNLVDDTAEETSKALEKESEAMDKVEKAAKKSAKSKKDFAKANKEDAQSADTTTTSVLAEAKAMDYLSTDVIDKQSDEFKRAAKTAHDYFEELGDIVSITRTMGTYNAFNKENNSYEKKQRVSYRVVDTEGRSRTFNPQGDLIGSKDVVNVTKAYDKLESIMKECYDLELKMQTEKGDAVIENKLVDARERYAKAEEEVNNLRDKGLSIAERELKINEKALAYNEALLQNTQKYYDNRSKRPISALDKTVVRAEDTINSELVNNNNGFKDNLRDLIKEAKNVDQHDIDRINELNDAINRLLRSDDAKAAKEGIVTKLMGLREQIARTVTSNTRMGSELRDQFQDLAKTADDMANHIVDFSPADVQKVIQQYKNLNTVMISTGQTGDSVWKKIGNRLTDMNSKLIAYYLSWMDIIRYIRTSINTIRELDTALVDLRKTTTMSTDELNKFYYSANETAQQMGVTTAEIINQAAAWSRLGYSSKEAATEMAALSSQFAQISPGMDLDTATDGLVSSMKAFGYEVDEVERKVMDNVNRIGNTMATTNEEIVQMLERSSAAMSAANNTIEETIALESAAVQVTRNAETTGTAFRTISMRIRGYDEETEEQLEDYEELKGKIADLTKTAKTPGGISLFSDKDKTTFKSTYQLLKDISEIWDELTDKEQAQLTEKLAGKRGGQVLSAIMNDFSEVERAMTEMSNAAGSADDEMKIIQDSIDYKLNALKESWVGFIQEALKREDTKELFDALLDGSKSLQQSLTTITPALTAFIKVLTQLLEVVAKVNSATGGLAGLAGLIYGGAKVKGKVNDVRGVMGGLLGGDKNKKSILSGADEAKSMMDVIRSRFESNGKLDKKLAGEYAKKRYGKTLSELEKLETGAASASISFKNLFHVTDEGTGAFGAFAAKLGLSSIALGGIIAGVAAAGYAIYKLATAQEEANKRINAARKEYEEQSNSIEEYREKALKLQNVANDNTKSIEEQQGAREDLLEIQKQMTEQFGVEASKINILTDSVDGLNRSFNNLNEHAYQEFLNKANDNSWDSSGFLWGLFNGENWSKLAAVLSVNSNIENLIKEYDQANFDVITTLDDKNAKQFQDALKQRGVNIEQVLSENGGAQFNVSKQNLESYYKAILDIQKDFENNASISDVLTREANRVNKILYDEKTGIASSRKAVLEHDVINKSYSKEVSRLTALKEELRQAQIEDNEEAVTKITQQLIDAYNEVIDKANNNETIENWFTDFVSEVQTLMNEQEFIAKIRPELDTEFSKDFNANKRVVANSDSSHMYEDEIIEAAQSDLTEQDLIAKYGEVVTGVIQYIRRVAEEEGISIPVIVEKLEIPNKAKVDLQKSLNNVSKETINNLSEDELEYLQKLEPYQLKTINSTDKLTQALKRYHQEQKQAWSKSEMIDQLNGLSDGFDKIDEIYADIYDKGSFDFAKLNTKKFKDAFEGLDVDYESFIETISGHTDDLEYCQEAFDNLIDTFIKQKGILDNVTKANADVTKSMLEMYGVANADELVMQALEKAEAKDWLAKKDLTNITPQLVEKLVEEGKEAGISERAIYDLMIAEVDLNNTELDLSSQIQQLRDIGEAAGLAAADLNAVFGGGKAGGDPYAHYYGPNNEGYINNKKTQLRNLLDEKTEYKPKQAKYSGGKSTKDAIDKANKSGEESKEIFDWIEKALQRQEEEINRIDKVVNATYKNWSKRNASLLSEITEINKEIAMQRTAYQAYMRDAEAIPLSEEYKKLVREGAMKSEIISDKTLKKNIKEYEELYDKAIKAKDAVADLESKIAALAKAKFDNVKSEFEGFTSEIEHFVNMIDKELSHVENMEKIAGKSFYNAKMDQDEKRLEELNKERTALVQALRDAEANGVEAGSADWIAMRNDIYSVDEAIADLTYEVEDLKKKLKEVAKLNFDDLKEQFENAISIINNQKSLTDAVVSLVETSGHVASRAYYEALIEGSKTTVTGLRKEYETLSKTLADAMSAGDIEAYDKQWYAMQNDIASVKNELVEAANATLEYANALRQINWDMFDRGLDVISKLNDEAEFFIELLSYSDLFNKDTGDWTDAGITTRGLMVQEYQDFVDQANAYGNEAEEIRKLLQADPKNTTLIDRYYELIEAQRQAILNAKKEKKAVEDLIKDGYDNLLERIKKLIDEYKKALNAAKDLHDYENTIDEKNKAISDIQKQLLAYGNGNDTSEENRATLQKLNADLIAAQKDLQETEYDRYISDQENLLDDFYSELEEWLNGRLDELSSLFDEAVAATNLNGKLIDDTLHETANSVNYRMTDEFTGIWDKYADESGIAATSLNILDLTHGVTDSIRVKMDELPTEASLEEFFNGDDLRILQELTSVNNNTTNMIDAINSTNAALDQIRSNIVEYSGILGNKIDYAGQAVANAVNSLEFSTGSSSYNAPSGGGSGGGSSSSSSTTKTQTQTATKKFKVLDEYGNVYQSGIDTAVHASQIANAYKGHKLDQLSKAVSSGMPQSEYNRLKALYNKIKVVAYAKGGSIGKDTTILDSIARLLGEDHMVAAKEGERILTKEQNKNFEKMVNANFTPLDSTLKDKYSMLSGVNGVDIASMMANMPTPQVGDNANIGNTTTVGDINITLPNVTNKEEFVQWLKTDGQVEKIIQSLTIGRMMGGNSYAKMKY